MLSDFLMLEVYFGHQNSALYFEDLVKRYGKKPIERAIESGDLKTRTLYFGSDKGKTLAWLTEQGRSKASPA